MWDLGHSVCVLSGPLKATFSALGFCVQVLFLSPQCVTKAPPDDVRAGGMEGWERVPGLRLLVWPGRTGLRPPCDTHQDRGQLPLAPHVQLEGQAVGQGSAEQQDGGEEDAEVGHSEICRPREVCLQPGIVGHGVVLPQGSCSHS